tara:strand:+ start:51343 stop:52155 length:813 start_codon:yes stop_codon:yes gene_type:complete
MKITIAIPVSEKDVYRLECVLLPSINVFFDKNFLHELILIYMPSAKLKCEDLQVKFPHLKIRCIDENEISNEPVNVRWRRRGWHYQQILKLGIAKFVITEKYLLMDADCFAIKNITEDVLIPNGKNLITFKSYYGYMGRWVRESSWLLKKSKVSPMMGVTPQIINTNIVLEMLDYLETEYDTSWNKILSHNKFTEYTLYWIYLSHKYESNDLYTEGVLYNEQSFVSQHNKEQLDIKEIFESDALFAIVQSVRKKSLVTNDITTLKSIWRI